jgi:hypothetical protein
MHSKIIYNGIDNQEYLMNYCTYCGTPLAKGISTCSNCGRINPVQSLSSRGPVSGILPSDPPLHEEAPLGIAPQKPVRTTTYYNIETPAHQAKATSFTQSNIPAVPLADMPAMNAPITPAPVSSPGMIAEPALAFASSAPSTPITPVPPTALPENGGSSTVPPTYMSQVPYPSQEPTVSGTNALPPRPPRKKMSFAVLISLIVVALVILFSVLGIVGYNSVYVPGQLHAKATARVAAQQTSDAKAAGTAFANEVTQEANAQAQANLQATATEKSQQNTYSQATSGTPSLNDPLQNGDLNDWDENDNCVFQNNAYVVTSTQQSTINPCMDEGQNFSNFAVQVHMKISQGDSGGLFLCANANVTQFYFLQIDSDGIYSLLYYPDSNGHDAQSILSGETSMGFNHATNADNVITVILHQGTFTIYMNKQYEMSAKDNHISSGFIGLAALDQSLSTTVQYTNMQVWSN